MSHRSDPKVNLKETLLTGSKDNKSEDSEEFETPGELPIPTTKVPIPQPHKPSGHKIGKQVMKIRRPEDTHTNIFNVSELIGTPADVKDAFDDLDMDEIIDFVGAEGKYQYMLIGQAALLSVVMSMILYAASYLLASPDFYCGDTSVVLSKCTESLWCDKFRPEIGGVDTWPEFNRDLPMVPGIDWKYPGWTKKYELVCENETLRENYLLMTELLPAFIGLFASVQSDTAGRVWTFKFWTIGIMVLSFAAAWIEVAWVQVVALSLFIGEEAILCTLFTYIINESCATSSPLRSKAIGFYFAIFASGGVLLSCLSWVVQDPQWLYFIVVCLSIAVSIPVQWTCYEPPKQLHKRGKVVGLLKNLEAIALRNDKGIEITDIQQKTGIIDVPLDGKMQISTLLTFKEKIQLMCTNLRVVFCTNICVRMVGLGLVAGSVYCCFFGVTYNAGKIGLPSLQLNVILLASIEAICYVLSIFVIAKTRRKCGTIICLLIILFGSCSLIIVHALWGEQDWNKYIETAITVVLIKGGLSMEYVIIYTYASELFPSTVRGTAVGFALTLAKVLAAFTSGPLIAFAETITASMVGPSITVVVGLLAILVLPETPNQKLE